VDELLAQSDYRGCEYNFTNLFCWGASYCHAIAQLDGLLVIRYCGRLGCSYTYPAGGGDIASAILELERDAAKNRVPLRLVSLGPKQVEDLERMFPGQFECFPDRDAFDYRYSIDKLADLSGKKLHAKRNHINRFLENNPDWSFAPLTADDVSACLAMDSAWEQESQEREGSAERADLRRERLALTAAFSNMEALGLEGGVLRAGGRLLGFTLADRLNSDSYDVHFEKAYGQIQGAYAMVNREFARMLRERHPEIRFLNREDDMGLEGLRKAKQSYYPDEMVEKYFAVRRQD